MKRQTDPYGKAFSFIFIFLLAAAEGLFPNRNINNVFFVLFFCLLLDRLAVRISLKFKTRAWKTFHSVSSLEFKEPSGKSY